ncbi:hypothetical protein [Methylotetracoccus oryzae]|uniref:hypothetical protein n=1 Tax=Methylotetracoccus oryzae TaxID=1919059 RepID=UPI0011193714|nr:hypothetical protein [Methylotetracoccus oryzae]
MIRVNNIARHQWAEFCDEFSLEHHGCLVATSVIEQEAPLSSGETEHPHAHLTARDFPFAGLHVLPNGRGLELSLGDGKLHIHELISEVSGLHLLETAEGLHTGLRIDKRNGGSVLLSFRFPARPETLKPLGVAAV